MWFSVNAIDSSVSSRFDGFSSHSHTVMQCQPIAASLRCSSLSRSLFASYLVHPELTVGLRNFATFRTLNDFFRLTSYITLCPCQKHPFTKMHVLYFLSTKSGCPGNRLWFNLYRKPLFHKPRRTIISGFVSFEWIAAMFL